MFLRIRGNTGGGALISRDKKIKQKAIFLATQAKNDGHEYNHTETGYNLRMSNILAGIGRGQMEVLNSYVSLRRRNYDFYFKHLNFNKHIKFLSEPKGYFSNRWLTCILLSTNKMREDIRLLLEKENIESRPSWKPMHLQAIFKDRPSYLNGNSENIYKKGLCLPSGSSLNEQDLFRIVSIINNYFER